MAVTLKDIAREVGVSVTTVSRGLAGYDDVAAETRERIQEVADQLGYHPNLTARRLQKQRTDTLGFIMPTFGPRFSDPFFSEFLAGIGNEAAGYGYDLLVSTHAPDSDREREAYARAVRGGWVDGLIVVRTRENDERIETLCAHEFPFVAFGRTDCNCDFPYVDEDGAAGMRLIVQHFIDLGHRRIGFIAPPPGLMFGRYRLRSFLSTMAANNLETPPDLVVEGDMTQRGGAEVVERLLNLAERPTAVIAGNDLMAIGALNRIQQRGLRVGQDLAVAGFDDIPLSAYTTPPLTTIHQPIYDIGRRTCAMLIEIINGRPPANPHILLTPELVVRESSGPPRTTN
ncbi:MAG: LacI family DNA-binding transcriptional regulator [Ardenticatenaceae bacterium]|nr:LacI family DNA-binding transcriptional regulator [Anaerolineales bacterium]MCB8982372.1 LacI family DNA-binding transcriptional regulator [Ardenticatenaceae bacterium]MCB8986299.1 LacI family DNA-binding transcriptional regulator [Ardenticatenaceae bacterium]